ncbi:MAG: twin-arginine translocation signal domain-containing protein [Candidatus Peribacteraceae bacterium]|nr:twin-arginine translocation signal domain-containing protein [Candidatus Peribacteraceae bacterium]
MGMTRRNFLKMMGLGIAVMAAPLPVMATTNAPKGYKIGTYIGTGVTDNFVDCGLTPAFVMVKKLTGTPSPWKIIDKPTEQQKLPQTFDVEGSMNKLNDDYLYMAFTK